MSRTVYVNWKYRCWLCKCPTDIFIEYAGDTRMIRDVASWATHRPIDFSYNLSIYKTKNCKAYRYCWACYKNSPTLSLLELSKREIGIPNQRRRPRARTEAELYEWFKGLYSYMNRPDVEDCEVKSVKTYWPLGLLVKVLFT